MARYKTSKGEVEHYRSSSNTCDTFRWTAGADVQKVWRKYGWTPPTEYRDDFLFKLNREANNG